jgi:hypothetical protein
MTRENSARATALSPLGVLAQRPEAEGTTVLEAAASGSTSPIQDGDEAGLSLASAPAAASVRVL